ncbi:FMN-dependent dehydrogenase [Mycobacterium intracellulare 1956]|uniref:FMN-dependent dehydrogenase n=1 Tax=Mycobacterium intracellulare 1956 TaxID=1299331 RepID=X8CCW7_MYCIT|nr:FMN-dependent dehydrogenase [Mycobacterium intracellulare 1956]
MAEKWFETVAIAQQRAKRRLPKSAYSSLISASEKGITVSDNVEAFGELGFAPHVVGAPAKRDMSTSVMGQDISMPVLISPTGVQAVHPDGEVAVARAAAARGTAMGLSSFASKPIEEVIAANPKLFFQLYWLGDRDAIAARVERARAAGAAGLIVTTDWSFSHGRDWGSPSIPEKMDLKTILKMSPEVITKPRWFLQWAKTMRPPELRVPNQGRRGEPGPRSSRPTASGWAPRRRPGKTSPGFANCGAGRSCSRA